MQGEPRCCKAVLPTGRIGPPPNFSSEKQIPLPQGARSIVLSSGQLVTERWERLLRAPALLKLDPEWPQGPIVTSGPLPSPRWPHPAFFRHFFPSRGAPGTPFPPRGCSWSCLAPVLGHPMG